MTKQAAKPGETSLVEIIGVPTKAGDGNLYKQDDIREDLGKPLKWKDIPIKSIYIIKPVNSKELGLYATVMLQY
jgi:hypothetical protein